MSKKHFDDYYKKVYKQYDEMMSDLKELEGQLSDKLVDPELVERIKKNIEPVKSSYLTLSYIKYLLDLPNRKEKEPRFRRQNKKFFESFKNNQDRIEETVRSSIASIKQEKGR